MSAVYTITNTITGRVYVGSTVSIRDRWNVHKSELGRGLHKNTRMQEDWDFYGASAFEFAVAERVNRSCLGHAESQWLARSGTNVYNIKTNTSRHLEEVGVQVTAPIATDKSLSRSDSAGMKESDFVTMKEAQELLGVSNYTIWQMVKTGRLEAYQSQVDRRRKLIRLSDIDRLKRPVKDGTPKPKPEGA